MQTELIHKYSHGLTFQSTWTWARNLADNESWPGSGFSGEITGDTMNQYNLRGDYGNVGGTRKHRWITTMVDELPIGKGRFLLGDAHGVLNGIVGGWRLSTILLVQTGPYATPFLQFDSSGNANNGFNRQTFPAIPTTFTTLVISGGIPTYTPAPAAPQDKTSSRARSCLVARARRLAVLATPPSGRWLAQEQ